MSALGRAQIKPVDEMPAWGTLSPKSLKGSPVTIRLYVEDAEPSWSARWPLAPP
jgi:hypothetical protein